MVDGAIDLVSNTFSKSDTNDMEMEGSATEADNMQSQDVMNSCSIQRKDLENCLDIVQIVISFNK